MPYENNITLFTLHNVLDSSFYFRGDKLVIRALYKPNRENQTEHYYDFKLFDKDGNIFLSDTIKGYDSTNGDNSRFYFYQKYFDAIKKNHKIVIPVKIQIMRDNNVLVEKNYISQQISI